MFDANAQRQPNYFAALVVGERATNPIEVIQAELADPAQQSMYEGPTEATHSSNPYQSPPNVETTVATPGEFAPATSPGFPAWFTDVFAVGISAGIFALLHAPHGPDWVPLFGLAIGLGYLYRRTHRMTPSLVVHFLLNLTSMLALSVSIYQQKP